MNINNLIEFYTIVPSTVDISKHPILLKTKYFVFGNEKVRNEFLENNKVIIDLEYKTKLLENIKNKNISLLIAGRLEYFKILVPKLINSGFKNIYTFTDVFLENKHTINPDTAIYQIPLYFSEIFNINNLKEFKYDNVLKEIKNHNTKKINISNTLPQSIQDYGLINFLRDDINIFFDNKKYNFIPNNKHIEKTIWYLPLHGHIIPAESSIYRLTSALKKNGFKINLLKFGKLHQKEYKNLFNKVIETETVEQFFYELCNINYSSIVYQGGLKGYLFGAFLVKNFNNVIVFMKDWNFGTKKDYIHFFGEKSGYDFEGIEYIFKNSKHVLSHFTEEEIDKWQLEYKCDASKFNFYPAFCHPEFFVKKEKTYNPKKICLAWAGSIVPSSYPEKFFPGKSLLDTTMALTKNNINYDFLIPEDWFRTLENKNELYMDFLYQDKVNKYFNLVKGRNMDPTVLNKYDFGTFPLIINNPKEKRIFEYAVVTKLAFYLEAGIPIIINRKITKMAEIVGKNKLGIVVDNNNINGLAKKLKKITNDEYQLLLQNVINYRKNFTYKSFKDYNIF